MEVSLNGGYLNSGGGGIWPKILATPALYINERCTFFVREPLEYCIVESLNLGGLGGFWACFLLTLFGDIFFLSLLYFCISFL
jgi:hypothetical protein